MKKIKYVLLLVIVILLLGIAYLALHWKTWNLQISFSANWHVNILPSHSSLLYEAGERYFGGDGISYYVFRCENDINLIKTEIPAEYSDKYNRYVVKKQEVLTDEQYLEVEQLLMWAGEVPQEYFIQQDEVDSCIKIESWLDDVRGGEIYIMQDCDLQRIYILEKYI